MSEKAIEAAGIDIDQRPAGHPALALLLAFLTAVKEKQNG